MRITIKRATWTAIVAGWTAIFAIAVAAKADDTGGSVAGISATGNSVTGGSLTGGSVSGTVTKDGTIVANAKVFLIKAPLKGARQGRRLKGGPTTDPSGSGTNAAGQNRPKPVGQTTTDYQGKFSLNGLTAGTYIVIAAEKGEGRAHQRVIVSDGKSASVTLSLVLPANAGANRRAAGGKQAKA